jgi:hypothetical protein
VKTYGGALRPKDVPAQSSGGSIGEAVKMREFLIALALLPKLGIRARRHLLAGASVFYREGREALLERTKARTALETLAVQQKRMELEFQRANNVVDLVKRLEKIKDPHLREKLKEFQQVNVPCCGADGCRAFARDRPLCTGLLHQNSPMARSWLELRNSVLLV